MHEQDGSVDIGDAVDRRTIDELVALAISLPDLPTGEGYKVEEVEGARFQSLTFHCGNLHKGQMGGEAFGGAAEVPLPAGIA